MKLSQQTILVTGGAGAVGRHLVNDLMGEAHTVIALDRDEDALADLGRQCPGVVCRACDLGSHEGVAETIASLAEDGHIASVVVNNAGSIHSEPLINLLNRPDTKHSPQTWHKTFNDNLHSVFYVTSCVAERMVENRTGGVIISVSSVTAAGNAGQSAYGAAKAAINSLTVTWSKELGPFGIRAVAIAPGFLDTTSTRHALSEANVKKWTKQTPLGRLGTLEEMARAVRFVIENDFYNGRILELDGGLRL